MSAIGFTQLAPQVADSNQILQQKIAAAQAGALGAGGSARYEDTAVHAVTFFCVVPIVDSVFAALVGSAAGETGVTQPAGIPLFGTFTSITLTSGKVRVYFFP